VLPDRQTTVRGAVSMLAVAFVALLFIGSYAGALNEPSPRDVPVAVAAQVPADAARQIDASDAFRVLRAPDAAAAARAVDRGEAYGAVVAGSQGLELLVAPAMGSAAETTLRVGLAPQLRSATADVTVRTVHPLPDADARGLVGFYTAVGWIVAGYLGATFLGIVFGTRPSRLRTAWRLSGILALAVVVGWGGAGLAAWIGGLGNVGLLGLAGMLTVAAAGTVTTALQSALGIIGTGVAILVFVILGNPSSGGPFATELLPEPWRTVGPFIPTGASTTAIRDIAYFPDAPLTMPFVVLGGWIAAGIAVALLLGNRRRGPGERDAALAAVIAG
jgi:hypothetical protein